MARRQSKRSRPRSCPCGTARLYERCCGRFHGGEVPTTAEELMRSRYAAYAKGLVDYVMETTDPEGPLWRTNERAWRAELEAFARETRFLGLSVWGSGEEGEGAWVEFEARLSRAGRPEALAERSRFVRRDGRWLYREAVG